MKTTVYLVRHGLSVANMQNRFCGHSDCALSESGRVQAQKAAEYLADKPVDYCYASDLSRAYHTAQIVAKPHRLAVIPDMLLREINGGSWENLTKDEIKQHFSLQRKVWETNIGYTVCEGGESVVKAQKRFTAEVRRLCELHEGKTLLIVAHALVIRAFCAGICGTLPDEIQKLSFPDNASVSVVTQKNGVFTLGEYNHNDYLHLCKK